MLDRGVLTGHRDDRAEFSISLQRDQSPEISQIVAIQTTGSGVAVSVTLGSGEGVALSRTHSEIATPYGYTVRLTSTGIEIRVRRHSWLWFLFDTYRF